MGNVVPRFDLGVPLIALDSNDGQKLGVLFSVLISPDQGASELSSDGLLRSLVQGTDIRDRSVKRRIQCSIEHCQDVWIVGSIGQRHSSHPIE